MDDGKNLYYDSDEDMENSPLATTFYAESSRREQSQLMEMYRLTETGDTDEMNVDQLTLLEEEYRRQVAGVVVEEDF